MLRKVGMTASPIFAAAAVKVDESKETEKKIVAKHRPTDLPIYTPLYPEEKYDFDFLFLQSVSSVLRFSF